MKNLPARVREYWLAQEVRIRPGASIEELDAFERRNGVRLPTDVRMVLRAVNGFEEGEWDEEMVEWYPISRWEPMTAPTHVTETFPDAASYYLFADYCLNGILYAIRLVPGPDEQGIVVGWTDGDPWQLASSFSELLEAYLREPRIMLG